MRILAAAIVIHAGALAMGLAALPAHSGYRAGEAAQLGLCLVVLGVVQIVWDAYQQMRQRDASVGGRVRGLREATDVGGLEV